MTSNNFALRISVDLRGLIAHWNCFVNVRVMIARWLYLAKRKKRMKFYIQGTRFCSILNLLIFEVLYNTNSFDLLGQYFAFGERLMFYSTRLRPPPPPGFGPRWIEINLSPRAKSRIARSTIAICIMFMCILCVQTCWSKTAFLGLRKSMS